MARLSRVSAAEKAEIVLQFLCREDTAARFARRYGPSEQTLWRYLEFDTFWPGEGGSLTDKWRHDAILSLNPPPFRRKGLVPRMS